LAASVLKRRAIGTAISFAASCALAAIVAHVRTDQIENTEDLPTATTWSEPPHPVPAVSVLYTHSLAPGERMTLAGVSQAAHGAYREPRKGEPTAVAGDADKGTGWRERTSRDREWLDIANAIGSASSHPTGVGAVVGGGSESGAPFAYFDARDRLIAGV